MKIFLSVLAFAALLPFSLIADEKLTCFELRTYHANEGKLENLHARFRDHTVALFEKHGMTNLIYWEPVENEENLLVYLLGYPDRASRDQSWKAFRDDPKWKAAYQKSTEDGKLVGKVDSLFLELTDYSPVSTFPKTETAPVYELRQYTTNEGKLDDLDARFRDHTIGLFSKHGITNLCYFHPSAGQDSAGKTLVYFISAPSIEARNESFRKFGSDPKWKAAREASERDGKILVRNGVKSMFLKSTDYSPVK